ncbi:Glycosyl hydrolase family 26 [Thermomonospora echinospora]|uniref:Glycosyl hydrolase family 26 n=1 Tax=Thermomonospora echinospora TaxID=1992 RepID=A0A1H6AE10_9ACTN|nr:glycosyl hydrolase [Thermomonospora echinospora]SEG46721.1 Glycosyl hydrolase family 26 [Thermomonospora echinospora]
MATRRSRSPHTGRRFRIRPVLAAVTGVCCGAVATMVALDPGTPSGQAFSASQAVRQEGPRPVPPPIERLPDVPGNAVPDSRDAAPAAPRQTGECTVDRLLVPSCGAWWGAAVSDFPQDQAVRDFEHKIGRPLAIYHDYHRGRKLFPTETDIAIAREPGRRRLLLLNWKPDDGESWAQVAAGSMDDHIDVLSRHIKRNFPERFWLAIHHEPEDEVRESPGSGYTATDFRNMFRHVVQRFRANGVDNAIFTVVFMAYSGYVIKPWYKKLYPGDDVVDWIGYDAYAFATTKTFSQLVDQAAPNEHKQGLEGFYRWSRRHFSDDKPMMLGEWGGSELSGDPGDKARLFRSLGRQIKNFPALKALVYWEHPNGPKFGDTRVDSSPMALQAYREIGRLPYFNPPVPPR